jgi:hypothetical protein
MELMIEGIAFSVGHRRQGWHLLRDACGRVRRSLIMAGHEKQFQHRVTRVEDDGDTAVGKPQLHVHFLVLDHLEFDRRVRWYTISSLMFVSF